jgi:hypothetical protein
LLPDVVNSFQFDSCNENRTWEQIASKNPQNFKSGGLAGKLSAGWGEWACWKHHPCLYELAKAQVEDYMCFVYNELDKTWHPWGIKCEIEKYFACPAKHV